MEDDDSTDYAVHSKRLVSDPRMLAHAARDRDYQAAADAFTSLQKNCANCHSEWR